MHSSAGCLHSSVLNLTPTRKLNSHNARAVLVSSKWLQCGTGRLWLLLEGHNSRKQNEHMSKLNCAPKLRRCHRTLSLPMPQHLRHLLQVQQPHNQNLYHGGLKSCCFSAVHIHRMPTVINTASVAASGQLLHLRSS
ncbi:hypothetical protein P692DRAFT_201234845 [Suillus brevipes Sb2]|nr:hypothetical protein P692DRAFT_201234845 [Suillus brevipes Sb2]